MIENEIKLISTRELLNMHFFIPDYQRGYRWSEQQVKDLLEDIWEFARKANRKDYEFYCLQPLVVKKMSNSEKQETSLPREETWYEVIDGQQRLTTIYLILASLHGLIEDLGLPGELYELRYQRVTDDFDGARFLKNIHTICKIDNTHIDYYHMSVAYQTICRWFVEKKVNKGRFINALLEHEYDNNEPCRDKSNNIRFIWYESVDEDPIKVFTRLNIGKISLTNAELIKAIFLNQSNFTVQDEAFLRLRQQEIASEWDRIEYTLQDEEFWLFLHEKDYERPTRIDFIFDLICEHNSLSLSSEIYGSIGMDDYRTFRYFYEYFRSEKHNIFDCWKEVKKIFQTFQEWFNDLEFYHYVGYLIENECSLSFLVKEWTTYPNKTSFRAFLKREIKKVIDKCPQLDFQYKEDGSNKGGIFYKFPFHLYKLEGWDVEHVHSNTTNPEDTIETQKEWLVNVYLSSDSHTQEQINQYFESKNEEDRNQIFRKIKAATSHKDDWTQAEKNRIWNYVLLDSSTNRSYGNSIFSGKRRVIIGKDKGKLIAIPKLTRDGRLQMSKESEDTSSFVPPCTKHVFMKYYSASMGDPNYWTKDPDAVAYLNDINECLKVLED